LSWGWCCDTKKLKKFAFNHNGYRGNKKERKKKEKKEKKEKKKRVAYCRVGLWFFRPLLLATPQSKGEESISFF
jgi:hypothetical protein